MLAAAGLEPPPSKMYVMRGLLMLFGTVPMGVAHWGNLGLDDERLGKIGGALHPLSALLGLCHFFVTMELTEDAGRLEVLHLALFWLAYMLPQFLINASTIEVMITVFFTYPLYAILNKIRKAVRAHQLRIGQLGPFVDEFVTQIFTFYAIPILYLTMESVIEWRRLEPWAIGSEPGADLDDEDGAALAEEAAGYALSVHLANFTFNALFIQLAICQLALFGTGQSNVRALMAFRVPGYQKVAGTALIVMGVIALYFQASKGEGTSEEVGSLFAVFLLAVLPFSLALATRADTPPTAPHG